MTLIGDIADDYAQALEVLEVRSRRNTVAMLRRSLDRVLTDLRRHYSQYLDALGPIGYDPARNPIRRPGAYSSAEATAKFRAILRDAAQFMQDSEIQQWAVAYEQDLREATMLGDEAANALVELVRRPDAETPFTGADPAAIRAATLQTSALIQGETARFRDQLAQIVSEGATRGWGPSRLERDIRQALRGARDPDGITQRLGLEQRAALIARSELANAYVKGSLERARQRGRAYVRVLAATDERVCPTCASRNGRVYPVDRVPIPYHPRCRCVAVSVANEAVEETDPATRAVLLDNERWQAEHEDGVVSYAEGQHRKQLKGLRSQLQRLRDPELIEAMDRKISRLEERGPDMKKARADLARALRIPTASEKRLHPGRNESLQESVPLFP
jgi:SPP1 gp7 family putative phage head morphogenesis protein